MVRVFLISSHRLYRLGGARVLNDIPQLVVADSAMPSDSLADRVREIDPDVMLYDLSLQRGKDLEQLQVLRRQLPQIPMVALVKRDGAWSDYLERAGVHHQVDIESSLEVLAEALTSCLDCQIEGPAQVENQDSPFNQLSEREMQVMMMVVDGQRVSTISDALQISPKTINTYRYRLFSKLGVDNDVLLTRLAIRHGLAEL